MSTFPLELGKLARWPHQRDDASWRYVLKGSEQFFKVSLVVPARNEELNLPIVAATLPPGLHEVIVVDGQSTDDTVGAARRCNPRGDRCRLGVPKRAM